MTLTPKEISTHCSLWLNPMTRHVKGSLGGEASNHVGWCLLQALKKFESTCGRSVRNWVFYKTPLLVIEAMRELDGRKGTLRHSSQAATSTLEGFDASEVIPEVGEGLERQESMAATMKTIEETQRLQRWILLGRVVGGFTNTDLQGITGVTEKQIRRETSHLRRLVSVARLPAPVRSIPGTRTGKRLQAEALTV